MPQNRRRLGPDPTGRAYSAPPEPLAGFRGRAPGKGVEKGGGIAEGERREGWGTCSIGSGGIDAPERHSNVP